MPRELAAAAREIAAQLLLIAENDTVTTVNEEDLETLLARAGVHYGHYSGAIVPAVIKVNPHTGRLTDILPVPENHAYVVTVGIGNILSAPCLRDVYRSGPNGRNAVNEVLRLMARNLLARACATVYQGWTCEVDGFKLPAFNSLAPELIRPQWTNASALRP